MADAKPLKLVDQGGGVGRLEEFGPTDQVPAENLPATEWGAETVSQAEAEAGTATTRRAWTAQRVRQAIASWWNGISSPFGRNLVAAVSALMARQELGLGSAAVEAVGTSGNAVPKLNTPNVFGTSQRLDAGASYISLTLARADQSGAGNTDMALMDVSTGAGHARFLHQNGQTNVVRGVVVKRTGDIVFFSSDAPERRLFHQGNILGTVSQAGGVPTGAIIERGSNANGEYVRFADGTQICSRAFSAPAVTTAAGALFRSDDISWTFPAQFSSSAVTLSLGINWGNMSLSSGSGSSAAFAQFRLVCPVSSTPVNGPVVTAIGRWN